MEFKFCGAVGSVTGSKHLVTCNSFQFLVDCGMVQERSRQELNWKPFLDAPRELDVVLLTHAHLDHCGLLPKLVSDGFRGRIYATPATLDLAELILRDSAHIQEEDAAFKRKRHERENEFPLVPSLHCIRLQTLKKPLRFSNQSITTFQRLSPKEFKSHFGKLDIFWDLHS